MAPAKGHRVRSPRGASLVPCIGLFHGRGAHLGARSSVVRNGYLPRPSGRRLLRRARRRRLVRRLAARMRRGVERDVRLRRGGQLSDGDRLLLPVGVRSVLGACKVRGVVPDRPSARHTGPGMPHQRGVRRERCVQRAPMWCAQARDLRSHAGVSVGTYIFAASRPGGRYAPGRGCRRPRKGVRQWGSVASCAATEQARTPPSTPTSPARTPPIRYAVGMPGYPMVAKTVEFFESLDPKGLPEDDSGEFARLGRKMPASVDALVTAVEAKRAPFGRWIREFKPRSEERWRRENRPTCRPPRHEGRDRAHGGSHRPPGRSRQGDQASKKDAHS